jgi:hypothetical protein
MRLLLSKLYIVNIIFENYNYTYRLIGMRMGEKR